MPSIEKEAESPKLDLSSVIEAKVNKLVEAKVNKLVEEKITSC